jgi:hypothetical protein
VWCSLPSDHFESIAVAVILDAPFQSVPPRCRPAEFVGTTCDSGMETGPCEDRRGADPGAGHASQEV